MQLGHLLTRAGLTYPEVSSKIYHDSFCQLDSSVSLPWVICFEAFYLHVVSSFSFIQVICPKLVLFLTPLQFVHLFCNLSKCILLFFPCIRIYIYIYIYTHSHTSLNNSKDMLGITIISLRICNLSLISGSSVAHHMAVCWHNSAQ